MFNNLKIFYFSKIKKLKCDLFSVLFFVILFFLLVSNSYALPKCFEFGERTKPFYFSKEQISQKITKLKNENQPPVFIIKEKNTIKIEFTLTQEELNNSYVFLVKDPLYKNYLQKDFLLYVNNQLLEQIPIFSEFGIFFIIDSYFLKTSENQILLKGINNKKPNIESAEMFSIFDYEEIHLCQIIFNASAKVQPPTHPDQLKYDVLHYDISLNLNMSQSYVSGILKMTAVSLDSSLISVPLDLDKNSGQMIVNEVTDDKTNQSLPFIHSESDKRLYITYPQAIDKGTTFTVKINYSGTPNPSGVFGAAYIATTYNDIPIVFTFSEPYGARTWFPCKDIPEEKSLADIHITCPTEYYAVSNGNLINIVNNNNGTSTYNWHESYPIVSYLISVVCSKFQIEKGYYTALDGVTKMEVAHYLFPGDFDSQKNTVSGTIDLIGFFARKFCEYPFLREKYYNVNHTDGASMEHQTCTSIRPKAFISSAGGGYASVNIHELSHQWFGDKITMRHFNHLWLNEGFATYCPALWREYKDGMDSYHTLINGWKPSDAYPIVSSSADQFSGAIVYVKGAWVLHMLRHVVGDDNFFSAIKNYITNPDLSYSTALSIDLQKEFEKVTGNDLSWFFNEWLYRAQRPNYQWSWSMHSEHSATILDLYLNQTQLEEYYIMPIDIKVIFSDNTNQTFKIFNDKRQQEYHLDVGIKTPSSVLFDPDNWVLKTVTQSSLKPSKPIILSVMNITSEENAVVVSWVKNPENYCNGYELYISEDGTSWSLAADRNTLNKDTTSFIAKGLESERDYYFYLRATNTSGPPSDFSDIYGCRVTKWHPPILIVEAFDRWETLSASVFKGAYYWGKTVDNCGFAFDICDNYLVGFTVDLQKYSTVLWLCGQESSANESLSSFEQSELKKFLDSNGRLFISGSEVGADLGVSGVSSAEDLIFYNDYLKAAYNGEYKTSNKARGAKEGIFEDIELFDFGTGIGDSYVVQYPDNIGTNGESMACLFYSDTGSDVAGIQYDGAYKLVYFAFPFETISDGSVRNQIMSRILSFFGTSSVYSNNAWILH